MALRSSEHPSVKQSGRRIRRSQSCFRAKLMHEFKVFSFEGKWESGGCSEQRQFWC